MPESPDRVRCEITVRQGGCVICHKAVQPGADSPAIGDAVALAVLHATYRPWQVLAEALGALLVLDAPGSDHDHEGALCDVLIRAANDYSTWWHHHDAAGASRNGKLKED